MTRKKEKRKWFEKPKLHCSVPTTVLALSSHNRKFYADRHDVRVFLSDILFRWIFATPTTLRHGRRPSRVKQTELACVCSNESERQQQIESERRILLSIVFPTYQRAIVRKDSFDRFSYTSCVRGFFFPFYFLHFVTPSDRFPRAKVPRQWHAVPTARVRRRVSGFRRNPTRDVRFTTGALLHKTSIKASGILLPSQ